MATEKKTVKETHYELLRELTETDKCPPQAKVILETLKAMGGKAGRKELIEKLKSDGALKTGQSIERVFGFYRPKLEGMGVMKEVETSKEIEVEVPDKPAKPAAAPKTEGDKTEKPAKAEKAAAAGVKDQKGEKKTA